MRGIGAVGAIVALSALLGCASETVEPGSSSAGLEWVRKADFVGQRLYYDAAISPRPMTAAEMGDTTWATPVQVVFYEDMAIAWWMPEGHDAQIGAEGHIVEAWAVVEHAQTISGDDVAPGTSGTRTNDPSEGVGAPSLVGEWDSGEVPGIEIEGFAPFARLDWLRQLEDIPFIPNIDPIHPGCLEE
jgi:hypothetical protein